jgi:hydroxymethylbilane synthase
VHSLKDVPSELAAPFHIPAVLPRAAIEDVLITRDACDLKSLRHGARIGTSSVRRARLMKWLRPDVEIVEIRGNVPTRVKKVTGEHALDAVLLARAGVLRLGLLEKDSPILSIGDLTLHALVLDERTFFPAAGQGAVGIECRAGDDRVGDLLRAINHADTMRRVTAEREFLRLLGAGCHTPVGVRTWLEGAAIHMAVCVFPEDDPAAAPREVSASHTDPLALAAEIMERGGFTRLNHQP